MSAAIDFKEHVLSMTPSVFALLKFTVTPLLVGIISLIARRYGASVAGLLIGFPIMTAPIAFFIALEQGPAFAARACIGVLFALAGCAAFCMAFVTIASWARGAQRRRRRVLIAALVGAIISFCGVNALLVAAQDAVGLDLVGAAGVASGMLVLAAITIPKPTTIPDASMPWWDIVVRMLATAAMVGAITALAARLGPILAGIVATYPVMLTVIGSFSFARNGHATLASFYRGSMLSMLSFALFFIIVGGLIEAWGTSLTFALATIAALAFSPCVRAIDGLFGGAGATQWSKTARKPFKLRERS
ncbi:MAG: hypothetical protein AAFR04_00790 [Pseudomonadota bacterium]